MAVDLNIEAIGSENRTEPIPVYISEKQLYNYTRIRSQLGQPNDHTSLFSESLFVSGGFQRLQQSIRGVLP